MLASASHRRAAARRPRIEVLEGRELLSTFTVTSTSDSGPGSLRAAIIASNTNAGASPNAIAFNIGSGGAQNLALLSSLPAITAPVSIDGTTQPGTGTNLRITLDGSNAGEKATGLTLDASNSTIKGLAVIFFEHGGILVSGGSHDTITDDHVGTGNEGKVAKGNTGYGLYLDAKSLDNTVSQDILSGNTGPGLLIDHASSDNSVTGCFVGTNYNGTGAVANTNAGIVVQNGSNANTIGGTAAGSLNVISGNFQQGVRITNSALNNLIEGNDIGTNAGATHALPNGDSGLLIQYSSNGNTVGGVTAAARNVLSGNDLRGIHIQDGADNNLIEGNYIGTDGTGAHDLGNHDSGILIDFGAVGDTVGGTASGAGNVISGNGGNGINITHSANNNVVQGNLIGTDASGKNALGNLQNGVGIFDNATGNTIGGKAAGASNVIAYNGLNGVLVLDAGHQNVIIGDTISDNGTNPNLSVDGNGVRVDDTSYTFVLKCTLDNNKNWGILLQNAPHTTVAGDTYSGNGKGGLHS
jgi:titin